jgi:hypothetical protein
MKLRREGKLIQGQNHMRDERCPPACTIPLYTNWKSCGSPPSEIFERESAALVCRIIVEPGLGNVDTHMPAGATPKA